MQSTVTSSTPQFSHAGIVWLLNLALPVMMTALGFLLFGQTGVEPVLALSEIVAAVGILSFAANLFINLKH